MNRDPAALTPDVIESVRSVRVEPDPPADFTAFWEQTVAELNAIPLELEIHPVTDEEAAFPDLEAAVWSANSLGGRRIAGPLLRPKGHAGPLPVWVYGHGYGSIREGAAWKPHTARRGFVTVGLDARGYNRSRVDGDPGVPSWILHGIESPADYILRGAVADTIRAVQVARALKGVDPKKTILQGGSFSGGLAVLAAPWINDLVYVAASVPTFGAYDLRRNLVRRGSGHEINELLNSLTPADADTIRNNLRYFDAVNAAPFVRTPISIGLGVVDDVVPGETVAAIYNALGSEDKVLLDFPCAHSTHPLARRWEEWERHVIERAETLLANER